MFHDPSLSIPPEAAWRLDGHDLIEVEINDGLQGLAGGAVAGCLRQGRQPGGILGLQGDKLANRGLPALHPWGSACRGWWTVSCHHARRSPRWSLVPRTIA